MVMMGGGGLFLSANVNGATCGPFVKQEMISLVLVYHHKGNKERKKGVSIFYFYFKIQILKTDCF